MRCLKAVEVSIIMLLPKVKMQFDLILDYFDTLFMNASTNFL